MDIKIKNNSYHIRTETMDNKEYLVVPVIMMVEGVHSGSHGPLLHTIDELGKYPASWNGIPVTINHPQDAEGNNISANVPDVLQRYSVGQVFNTHVDGQKLKAEAWIDVTRITALSTTALEYIRANRPLDVSVGVFTDELQMQGSHSNEQYEAIATNHRPDHLALLPGGTGACSWNDGCGVRVNKEGEKQMKDENKITDFDLKEVIKQGFSFSPINTNQRGYQELANKIQQQLDAKDRDGRMHYLVEFYENSLIYQVRQEGGETRFYRVSYSVDSNEMVILGESPEEVRREVNFLTVNEENESLTKNQKMVRTKNPKTMEKEEKKTPCCLAKVEGLIANEATRFTEDNKEWLLAQEEATLDLLSPVEKEPKEDVHTNADFDVKEAITAYFTDNPGAYKEFMTPEEKAQQEYGLRLYREKRETLIKSIMDNSKEVWTEDELKSMQMPMLEKISRTTKTVNYSGMAAGGVSNGGEIIDNEEVLLPPGVEATKKKEE